MSDELTNRLWNKDIFDKYDDKGRYKDHVLEQYKLYLEMTDKLSDRRQTANSFFLTLNTALCAALGFLFSKDSSNEIRCFCFIIPIAGLLLSYFWSRLVASYRQLSTGKFEIVHLMEQHLPAAPYTAEWTTLGQGKKSEKYKPLTHIEVWVPRLFIILYCILIVYLIPWGKLCTSLHVIFINSVSILLPALHSAKN